MHDERSHVAGPSQATPQKRAPGTVTRRSKVTNGKWRLPGVDNRLPMARRFRDLCTEYARQVGGDLTEAEKSQIRQAALLTMRAEGMQAAQVIGEPIDEEMAIRLSSEIRRILTPIIERSAARRDAAAPSAIRDRLTGAAA
ncbi:MAG TPA: hypothetical protein VN004_06765 [Pseudorhodoplanes sp.]|nr:hypothetical protein [Pseudorhodoplanes sp.]